MRLDYQTILKSPPLNLLAGSAPELKLSFVFFELSCISQVKTEKGECDF